MFTRGEFLTKDESFGALVSHSKQATEIVLVSSGQVASAFRHDETGDYSFLNNKAKEMYKIIKDGIGGCKSKNGSSMPFPLGTSVMHEFTKSKTEYLIELFNSELVSCKINCVGGEEVNLAYTETSQIPPNIPYVKLTTTQPKKQIDDEFSSAADDEVVVRSVAEIALEKEDVSWLKNKKYYIVNEDDQAEQLFSYLDNYSGPISYDTETTGLRINCFGKIGSPYKKQLEEYNAEHPNEQIRADRLVGIIFCIEDNVSYYFPCFNRKFKNLYDTDTTTRQKIINDIKVRYTIGEFATKDSDLSRYIRSTPAEQWGSDVILMERVRNILSKKHIVAHNGSFEWKVGWQYEIDTNLRDDTMIMHQIMYKFRSTTSNRGEPSNLKYLAKVELGIDQWELSDFFPDFKDDTSGLVRAGGKGRGKKGNSKIDFSYMTYEGTRVYAPTDGDVTLLLFKKYKADMMKNHKEQEYIYNVEVLVSCAIGYMEFYGHRIDEEKIYAVRDQTKAEIACIESEIRQQVGFSKDEELERYNLLKEAMQGFSEADKHGTAEERSRANEIVISATADLYKAIENDKDHELNLASPSQVAELFYDVLGYPLQGDKKSVAKKQIKPLVKAKNEDGSATYPVAKLYSDYKVKDTLMTKFFDNLTYYMYPGGLIFSSFGQISTATGRMSCSKPNAQQYPKAITNIVVPRPGYVMMDADYSQIEYRVLTALAGNEWLAELFSDPDSDYHTLMASMMYGVDYASVTPKMRSDAKSFNFGIPYGMGFKSLAILLKGNSKQSSVEEAKEKYELYFKNQPKTRKFFDQVKEMAQVNKYTKTFWNRYRYYSFTDADGNENNARKAAALRQAGNAVIQGTAADIFKISVARNFMYIRENNLLGKLLIINMIHDEQLFEVDVQSLNMQRVLADVGRNMQFKVNGFPPLYIGAGIGPAWGKAKGKMAEIHPVLLEQFTSEAANIPLWRTDNSQVDPKEVLKYFDGRVYKFREQKVEQYLLDPANRGKDLHPAIGNLLNLQFTYGHDKEKEGLDDNEFTLLCVDEFIKHNNLEGITSGMFTANTDAEAAKEDEEDEEYNDGDEEEEEDDLDFFGGAFTVIDEKNELFGSSLQDLIAIFHFFVSPDMGVCCIDSMDLSYQKKDELVEFLCQHLCNSEDEGAMELIFLQPGNILNRTGTFVKGISDEEIEKRIGNEQIA